MIHRLGRHARLVSVSVWTGSNSSHRRQPNRINSRRMWMSFQVHRLTEAVAQPMFGRLSFVAVESRCGAVALGSNISVPASFVWRCLTGSTMAPFPHPAHRTGHADLPHPALGQDLTPSSTARRAQACSSVRARSARTGARVDSSRPCAAA
jgi:hypothetical protein